MIDKWVKVSFYVAPDGACRLRQPGEPPVLTEPVAPPVSEPAWVSGQGMATRTYKAFTRRFPAADLAQLQDPEFLQDLVYETWAWLYPGEPHPEGRPERIAAEEEREAPPLAEVNRDWLPGPRPSLEEPGSRETEKPPLGIDW